MRHSGEMSRRASAGVTLRRVWTMELLLLRLVLVPVLLCGGQPEQSPVFCHDKQCLRYKLIEKHEDYEVREYGDAKWLTTQMKSLVSGELMSANSRLKKEAGTCKPKLDAWPVRINVLNGNEFFLSWHVPEGTACKIQDASVPLQETPGVTVYVRSYKGTPSIERAQRNAELLHDALPEAEKTDADAHTFTWAGYNSYLDLSFNNEIWIRKTQ